ncbi:MAG: MlaD family protein [Treponema sp.]|nr:MlaD family protein [Treponema sp.]
MKFRIRYADRVVGLFVLVALLALAAGIILLGANQRWFSRDFHFTTRLDSAAGASPGTPIYLKGFQVGKVERLSLNEGNEVDADFVIFDKYYPKVRENSVLELVTSPIGLGTQLLFDPGKSDAVLKEGSFIPTADSPEGRGLIEQGLVDIPPKDDTITRLLADVSPLLENLNKTVITVDRTLTEVNRAVAGRSDTPLANILGEASKTMTKVDGIAGSIGVIADNLRATTTAIRDPTGLIPRLLDAKGSLKTLLDDKGALYSDISSSLAELQASLKNVQEMTTSLNAQMPSIAVTLDEGRTAIKQAQDVLEGLKNNPLLRGGIPKKTEQESTYQSMREGQF